MNSSRHCLAGRFLVDVLLTALIGCGGTTVSGPAAVAVSAEEAPDQAAPAPVAEAAPTEADGFRFPDDRGGAMLARRLPPSGQVAPAEAPSTGPRRLPVPSALESPSVPLPPNQGLVPRLPAGKDRTPPRPRPLAEEPPLSDYRLDPERPHEHVLPAGARARRPGPDVNQPAALPVLAGPAPDRASLDDPTADFSASAVRAATPPVRATPAPFLRLTLPDPFEYRDAARVRTPPPDDAPPVTASPRPPPK